MRSPIVKSVEIFRDGLQQLKPSGETALNDAIGKALDMLDNYTGETMDTCLKRVIVLTDGKDTDSTLTVCTIPLSQKASL